MAENKNYIEIIKKLNFRFNDYYRLSYLTYSEYQKASDCFRDMRREKIINGDEYHLLIEIYNHYRNNHDKIRELIYQQPRLHAQRFIGKNNIREFIFKRDKYKCLCCGSNKNLSIDHIHSILFGGKNEINNLQTLCKSCNSKKGTNFYDYR